MNFDMRNVFIIVGGPFYYTNTKRYHIGGIQTYVRRLINLFSHSGYYTYVINDGEKDDSVSLGNGVIYIQVSAKTGDIKALVRKAEVLGDLDNDILLFSTSTEVVKSNFKHKIGIQHGIYWDTNTIRGFMPSNYLTLSILRSAQMVQQIRRHRMVGTLICVDVNYVNWLRACGGIFDLKYVYIPNCAAKPTKDRIISSDNNLKLLYARRFVKPRGIELLMEALPPVLDMYPNVTLTIAGQGMGQSSLQETFKRFGNRVIFTQYDALESVDFHLSYDIAMVPSLYSEGTSLSLLEAMSAGCACVATDVGGLSNIIIDRHNGILIRPKAEDLRDAVSYLIENKEQRLCLAKTAKQTIDDSFGIGIWTQRWENFLLKFYPPDNANK